MNFSESFFAAINSKNTMTVSEETKNKNCCAGCKDPMNSTYMLSLGGDRYCLKCMSDLVHCVRCKVGHYLPDLNGHTVFLCDTCRTRSAIEAQVGSVLTNVGHENPPPPIYGLISGISSADIHSISRAIFEYIHHHPTDEHITARAYKFFKKEHKLPEETKVFSIIKMMSNLSGGSPIKMTKDMAHLQEAEGVIDAIIEFCHTIAFNGYERLLSDKLTGYDPTFCRYPSYVREDIPWAIGFRGDDLTLKGLPF